MDDYTEKTKKWLDKRFKMYNEQGVYFAHQPIYGFGKGNYEPYLIPRYVRTYQIMKALSHLKFKSLLDVGAAEGYQSHIASQLFKVKVECCDLSEEACRRAKEIFNLRATPVDIHNLPFRDNEFDVIICSETLEHITDIKTAMNNLLRIAKKAVIVTVPHESKEAIENNIKQELPHAHIHNFDVNFFDYLKKGYKYQIFVKRINIPKLAFFSVLLEGTELNEDLKNQFPKILFDFSKVSFVILRKFFLNATAAFLIQLDNYLCNHFRTFYGGILFIILKDNQSYSKKELKKISASKILNITVPLYYLKNRD